MDFEREFQLSKPRNILNPRPKLVKQLPPLEMYRLFIRPECLKTIMYPAFGKKFQIEITSH